MTDSFMHQLVLHFIDYLFILVDFPEKVNCNFVYVFLFFYTRVPYVQCGSRNVCRRLTVQPSAGN